MPSDSHWNDAPSKRNENVRFDMSQRADLHELMDGPCSYKDLRACLYDLAQVNRVTFAYRPTLDWLEHFSAHGNAPLHIVDVGSGGGDMLRRIEQWARRRGVSVRLTGIDLNPFAVRAAQEFTPHTSAIRWVVGDAHMLDNISDPIDLVISSLFTHHLSNAQIVQFMAWMERVSQRGWFINDLSRSQFSFAAFQVLARAAGWHRFVQHDGPVSIRRAFQPQDWKSYAKAAGLRIDAIRIEPHWPGRLTVARERPL